MAMAMKNGRVASYHKDSYPKYHVRSSYISIYKRPMSTKLGKRGSNP